MRDRIDRRYKKQDVSSGNRFSRSDERHGIVGEGIVVMSMRILISRGEMRCDAGRG